MRRVTLNLIATNNYTIFLENIIKSAKEFFANDCDLSFIVYTNSDNIISDERITRVKIENEAWPLPTLKRFHYFLMAEDTINESDFSFYIDVDSMFIRDIKISEVFKKEDGLVVTLHPGFIGRSGTPERNPDSTAYIPLSANVPYFCGGFFGGDSKSFIEMAKNISNSIDIDLKNGIIAIWHDESHLNKYFLTKEPAGIFGDGFTEAEGYSENRNPYIVFLDKGSDTKRNELRALRTK